MKKGGGYSNRRTSFGATLEQLPTTNILFSIATYRDRFDVSIGCHWVSEVYQLGNSVERKCHESVRTHGDGYNKRRGTWPPRWTTLDRFLDAVALEKLAKNTAVGSLGAVQGRPRRRKRQIVRRESTLVTAATEQGRGIDSSPVDFSTPSKLTHKAVSELFSRHSTSFSFDASRHLSSLRSRMV